MENRNTLYKMRKAVTHIDCPKDWESENDWDSHRPMLYLATQKLIGIDGFRIEVGSGYGSTALLTAFYKDRFQMKDGILSGEAFVSFETNKAWSEEIKNTVLVRDYFDVVDIYGKDAAMVFMDCAPAELRKGLINLITDTAKVIVIHDTEPGADYVYKLSDILGHNFKYRLDYEPKGKPHTTAVSNTVNVSEWI